MLLPPLIWKHNPRARRLSLRIDPRQRAVIITLPPGMTQKEGLSFFHSQTLWVSKALSALPARAIETGSIPLEGRPTALLREADAKRGVWLDQQGIHISGKEEHLERRLKDFLRHYALRTITPVVTDYSHRMALFPTQLAFRDTKSRWGSCTQKGRLMLNWRLLFTPPAIRDYVIVHELAHLRHFHHGINFWKLVDSYCPRHHQGRIDAEHWLKTNGSSLLSII